MLTRFLTFLIVLSVILIPGCAEPHRPAAPNERAAAAAISQPADPPTIAPQTATEPEGQITLRDAILTVVSPIEDTPAFRAGVVAGRCRCRRRGAALSQTLSPSKGCARPLSLPLPCAVVGAQPRCARAVLLPL